MGLRSATQQLKLQPPDYESNYNQLVEGVPIFRASSAVKARIEELLTKQQSSLLNLEEAKELDCYEEIDDYLSFVNRLIRNQFLIQTQQAS